MCMVIIDNFIKIKPTCARIIQILTDQWWIYYQHFGDTGEDFCHNLSGEAFSFEKLTLAGMEPGTPLSPQATLGPRSSCLLSP